MSAPTRHHYIPQFHLDSWTDPKGFLCEMRLINGKVVAHRRSTRATGFQDQLYQIEGVGPDTEQHLELKFFRRIDNDAAQVMQAMLRGDPVLLTVEQRQSWARYILSLRYRDPETVKDIKSLAGDGWLEAIKSLETNYSTYKQPGDPETLEEFKAGLNPTAPMVSAANMLMRITDNERNGQHIAAMHWSVHHVASSRVPLLLTDRPFDWPFGLSRGDAYIAFPIAPYAFFLASSDRSLSSRLSSSHTQLVRHLNAVAVSSAREFVWGTDESARGYVEQHVGTQPAKRTITEKHVASTLAAARGEKLLP